MSVKRILNPNYPATWQSCTLADSFFDEYLHFTDVTNGNLIKAEDDYIYYSTDNGVTWQQSNAESDYDKYVIANDGSIIIGADGDHQGAMRSTDGGITWQEVDTLSGTYIDYLIKASNGNIIVGTPHGIMYSTDYGASFSQSNITSGLYNQFMLADSQHGYGNIIASGSFVISGETATGIKYSTDNGATWQDSNLTTGTWSLICKASNGYLVALNEADHTPYYSIDNGVTWQVCDGNSLGGECDGICITDTGRMFMYSKNNYILMSSDNGASWSAILDDYNYYGSVIYDGSTIFAEASYGIVYSIDDGDNWQNTNIGQNDDTMWLEDFKRIGNTIYAFTRGITQAYCIQKYITKTYGDGKYLDEEGIDKLITTIKDYIDSKFEAFTAAYVNSTFEGE